MDVSPRRLWPIRTIHAIVLAVFLTARINGHMEMAKPYPIDSNLNPLVPYYDKDYSYTSPLDADGSNFPCKGYQNQRPIIQTATYRQGGTYEMAFAGSATHGGGSCQISLSYDNGRTFRVIKSMIGGCPLQSSYNFTIPEYAPVGSPLLAWTWMNEIGNREYYMNCAWVDIQAAEVKSPIFGPGSKFSHQKLSGDKSEGKRKQQHKQHNSEHRQNSPSNARQHHTRRRKTVAARSDVLSLADGPRYHSFDQLPFIWKANLPPINDCGTIEGEDVVFTNPGPDVVYGNGYSASSPKTPNKGCDTPGPPGPAYKKEKIGPFGSFDHGGSGYGGGGGVGASSSVVNTPPFPTQTASSPVNNNPATLTTITTPAIPTSPTLPSSSPYSSPNLPSYSSPNLPSYSSPTLPSPTLPSISVPFPTGTVTNGRTCDSSIPGLGFKCLRQGYGFAICDQNTWIDMGQTAYGTKCMGEPGAGLIVPYHWSS